MKNNCTVLLKNNYALQNIYSQLNEKWKNMKNNSRAVAEKYYSAVDEK